MRLLQLLVPISLTSAFASACATVEEDGAAGAADDAVAAVQQAVAPPPPCVTSATTGSLVWSDDYQKWQVYGYVALCPARSYPYTFEVTANSTLECSNSVINPPLGSTGLRFYGNSASASNCQLNGVGVSTGIVSNLNLRNVDILGITEAASGDVYPETGMVVKALDSTFQDCEVSHTGGIGIEVRGGHRNTFYRNSVSYNGDGQGVGIKIDGGSRNTFSANTISNNGRFGVLIYRNCGEHNKGQVPEEAHSNTFTGNTINGHRVGNKAYDIDVAAVADKINYSSHVLGLGVAIAIAARQGKALPLEQDWYCEKWGGLGTDCERTDIAVGYPYQAEKLGLCNNADITYARWDWSGDTKSTTRRSTNGRMRDISQWLSYNTGSFDHKKSRPLNDALTYNHRTSGAYLTNATDFGSVVPNFDFAPNTDVNNNKIYDNDIGVLVGDQETRIVSNNFYVGGASNHFTDIFVGNKNLDFAALPNRYVRAMWGNTFNTSKAAKYLCRVSTTQASSSGRINGSDASKCTVTFPYRL